MANPLSHHPPICRASVINGAACTGKDLLSYILFGYLYKTFITFLWAIYGTKIYTVNRLCSFYSHAEGERALDTARSTTYLEIFLGLIAQKVPQRLPILHAFHQRKSALCVIVCSCQKERI